MIHRSATGGNGAGVVLHHVDGGIYPRRTVFGVGVCAGRGVVVRTGRKAEGFGDGVGCGALREQRST